MSYNDIVNVSISLDVATVTQTGFGVPLFIDDHMWFLERSKSYGSVADAAKDLPIDSAAYAGVVSAFSGDLSPSVVKVGRRAVTALTYTPEATPTEGAVITITLLGSDAQTTVAVYTVQNADTPTDVVTGLKAAIGTVAGATVSGTSTLILTGTTFAITSLTAAGGTYETTGTETGPEAYAAIRAEDDDFFFVGASDHTAAGVKALAAAVEATTKEYFVATNEAASTANAYDVADTDILAVLKTDGMLRSFGFYHQDADTAFPEMGYMSILSVAAPGSSILANNAAPFGVSSVAGLALSVSQKENLISRNASFVESRGGSNIIRGGTSAGDGTFTAALIRNRDFAEARLNEDFAQFLISSKVVPYTDSGITQCQNVAENALDRMVSTETQPNILQERNPYTVNFPLRSEVSTNDVSAGHLVGTAILNLAGSIRDITFTASMTYES